MSYKNDNDKLTRVEETLVIVLALAAARRTGEWAREHGYSEPAPEQSAAMGWLQVRALTEMVRGLRDPGATPSEQELDELAAELAAGALEHVMGRSPAKRPGQN